MKKNIYLFSFIAILLGIITGASGAYLSILWKNPKEMMVKVGDWYQMPVSQSEHSSLWRRAWIAYHGPLALKETDALYLARRRDDHGDLLRENCKYIISGSSLPAKWWAITVYDREGFLPVSSTAPSRHSEELPTEWKIELSRESLALGISTKSAGDFSLMLRLYGPQINFLQAEKLLPEIKRVSCESSSS